MLEDLAEVKWKSECKSCPYLVEQKDSIFNVIEKFSGDKTHLTKLSHKNILIVNKGRVRLNYADESGSFVMSNHEMIFLTENPNLELTFIEDSTLLFIRFDSYGVVCKDTKLDSYLSGEKNAGYITPTYLPMLTSFRRLAIVAERLFSKKLLCSYYQKVTRDSFLFLLDMFYSENQLVSFFAPILNKEFKFKNFILKTYKPGMTVKELIEQSKLSRSSFYELFQAEFGETAKKWMVARQVEAIRTKLKDSSLSLKDIMFDTGFDNPSQFARFCKSNLNDTPTNLLRILRN